MSVETDIDRSCFQILYLLSQNLRFFIFPFLSEISQNPKLLSSKLKFSYYYKMFFSTKFELSQNFKL